MPNPKIVTVEVSGKDGFGGLYNVVLGDEHEHERVLAAAAALGLEEADFGRARDAWVETFADGTLRWAVYTRNGGRNRSEYARQIRAMRGNRYYQADVDDTLDSTYATFYFEVPEEARKDVEAMAIPPVDTDAMWREALSRVKRNPKEAARIAQKAFPNVDFRAMFDQAP